MKTHRKALLATLVTAGFLMAGSAHAALIVTTHPEGASETAFYDSLTNVATGTNIATGGHNQFSLDVNDTDGQSFTLASSITLDSIYFAYAEHQSSGSFDLRIDDGNNGSKDYTYSVSVPIPDDQGGTAGWPDSQDFNWIQFDLTTENITLGAGQHNFSIRGVTDNGEGSYLIGPWFNQSATDVYTGGQLLSNSGRDMYFAVTAVPEPGALALLGLGGLLITARRRR